ncbi:uncharacterized protein LOC111701899 isoform X3 [Eurytemora carolleeae]|uniref:uncharacterized protein LOC111701899 isoform X3 n=1 Tax=Eurytemora carolleeae TaxID=1294199 RepID=UPI000C76C375|nr:uncharacterized protein LOC111701899 isoform X3 [Eurytemora carolleeae]|eukprot:XP_023329147.1 uncharacterized protein LOC111701899 isoform X3 [Eurytemora affinis]
MENGLNEESDWNGFQQSLEESIKSFRSVSLIEPVVGHDDHSTNDRDVFFDSSSKLCPIQALLEYNRKDEENVKNRIAEAYSSQLHQIQHSYNFPYLGRRLVPVIPCPTAAYSSSRLNIFQEGQALQISNTTASANPYSATELNRYDVAHAYHNIPSMLTPPPQILAGGCTNLIGTAVSLLPVVHPSSYQKSEYWTKYLEEKAAERKPRYDKSEFRTTYIEDKKRNVSGKDSFEVICEYCPSPFPYNQEDPESVEIHASRHGVTKFQCAGCGIKLDEYAQMETHIEKDHVGADDELVKASILVPSSLEYLKIYQCGIRSCGRRFIAQPESSLRKHIRNTHGEFYIHMGKGRNILRICRLCPNGPHYATDLELCEHLFTAHPPSLYANAECQSILPGSKKIPVLVNRHPQPRRPASSSGGKFERLLKTRDTQEKPGEDQVNTGKEDASPDDKETAPDDQDENPVDECRIKDPEEIAKKRTGSKSGSCSEKKRKDSRMSRKEKYEQENSKPTKMKKKKIKKRKKRKRSESSPCSTLRKRKKIRRTDPDEKPKKRKKKRSEQKNNDPCMESTDSLYCYSCEMKTLDWSSHKYSFQHVKNEKKARCLFCPQRVWFPNLKTHIRESHRGASFVCNASDTCFIRLMDLSKIVDHINTKHRKELEPLHKMIGQTGFISPHLLTKHGLMILPADLRKLSCRICSQHYLGQGMNSVARHFEQEHADVKSCDYAHSILFECRGCDGLLFGSESFLKEHVKEIHSLGGFKPGPVDLSDEEEQERSKNKFSGRLGARIGWERVQDFHGSKSSFSRVKCWRRMDSWRKVEPQTNAESVWCLLPKPCIEENYQELKLTEELEEDCENKIKEKHVDVEENCEEVISRSSNPEELNWSNASDLDYQENKVRPVGARESENQENHVFPCKPLQHQEPCLFCNKTLPENRLENHFQRKHGNLLFSCDNFCCEQFQSPWISEVITHLKVQHDRLESDDILSRHYIRIPTNLQLIVCKVQDCDEAVFLARSTEEVMSALKTHQLSVHPNRDISACFSLTCRFCGSTFNYDEEKEWSKHIAFDHRDLNFSKLCFELSLSVLSREPNRCESQNKEETDKSLNVDEPSDISSDENTSKSEPQSSCSDIKQKEERMYVSRINLDKSLGEDEYTEDKEGHTENEDDPHTEMDVLPSKQEICPFCLDILSGDKLIQHILQEHENNLFCCPMCSDNDRFRTWTILAMKNHYLQVHPGVLLNPRALNLENVEMKMSICKICKMKILTGDAVILATHLLDHDLGPDTSQFKNCCRICCLYSESDAEEKECFGNHYCKEGNELETSITESVFKDTIEVIKENRNLHLGPSPSGNVKMSAQNRRKVCPESKEVLKKDVVDCEHCDEKIETSNVDFHTLTQHKKSCFRCTQCQRNFKSKIEKIDVPACFQTIQDAGMHHEEVHGVDITTKLFGSTSQDTSTCQVYPILKSEVPTLSLPSCYYMYNCLTCGRDLLTAKLAKSHFSRINQSERKECEITGILTKCRFCLRVLKETVNDRHIIKYNK